MNRIVVDTHTLLWALFTPAKLSPAAAAVRQAEQSGTVYISAISIVEVIYLIGRATFNYPNALARIVSLITDPAEPFDLLPLDLDVALAVERVPRNEVPDMPDRIIAATAVAHNLPVVS